MHTWIIPLVFGILLGTHVTWAQQMAPQPRKPLTPQEFIESADKDKNGYVDRLEYLKRMSDAFFFLDTNKDGFLSLGEMQPAVPGIDRKRFEAADTNHDGKLSLHEYLRAMSHDFDAADLNDDGVLDHNEIHRWLSPQK